MKIKCKNNWKKYESKLKLHWNYIWIPKKNIKHLTFFFLEHWKTTSNKDMMNNMLYWRKWSVRSLNKETFEKPVIHQCFNKKSVILFKQLWTKYIHIGYMKSLSPFFPYLGALLNHREVLKSNLSKVRHSTIYFLRIVQQACQTEWHI